MSCTDCLLPKCPARTYRHKPSCTVRYQLLRAVVSCRFYVRQATALAGLTRDLATPEQCIQLGGFLTDLKFVFTDANPQGMDDATGLMNNMQVRSRPRSHCRLSYCSAHHMSQVRFASTVDMSDACLLVAFADHLPPTPSLTQCACTHLLLSAGFRLQQARITDDRRPWRRLLLL